MSTIIHRDSLTTIDFSEMIGGYACFKGWSEKKKIK